MFSPVHRVGHLFFDGLSGGGLVYFNSLVGEMGFFTSFFQRVLRHFIVKLENCEGSEFIRWGTIYR